MGDIMKLPFFTARHSSDDPDAIIVELHAADADGNETVSTVTFADSVDLMNLETLTREFTKLVRGAEKKA